MGQRKVAKIDTSQDQKETRQKQTFDWENAYSDLSTRTANALREARLKPDQIRQMTDGELLAVSGIGEVGLEEIRSQYPPQGTAPKKTTPKEEDRKEKKEAEKETVPTAPHPKTTYPRHLHGRSQRYQQKQELVDNSRRYPLDSAVRLLRRVAYSTHNTVELHLNVKSDSLRGEINLPHSTGQQQEIAIFSDKLAKKIKKQDIDFDILLAKPEDMDDITPLAKILGPRGLMPNPKSNTIVKDPQKRKQELESGTTLTFRTQPKAPIIHLVIGSLDLNNQKLHDNLVAALQAVNPHQIKSAYLKTTMSPSIKLDITELK